MPNPQIPSVILSPLPLSLHLPDFHRLANPLPNHGRGLLREPLPPDPVLHHPQSNASASPLRLLPVHVHFKYHSPSPLHHGAGDNLPSPPPHLRQRTDPSRSLRYPPSSGLPPIRHPYPAPVLERREKEIIVSKEPAVSGKVKSVGINSDVEVIMDACDLIRQKLKYVNQIVLYKEVKDIIKENILEGERIKWRIAHRQDIKGDPGPESGPRRQRQYIQQNLCGTKHFKAEDHSPTIQAPEAQEVRPGVFGTVSTRWKGPCRPWAAPGASISG